MKWIPIFSKLSHLQYFFYQFSFPSIMQNCGKELLLGCVSSWLCVNKLKLRFTIAKQQEWERKSAAKFIAKLFWGFPAISVLPGWDILVWFTLLSSASIVLVFNSVNQLLLVILILLRLILVLYQCLREIWAKILTPLKLNVRFGIDVSISKICMWWKHYPSHIVLKCHEAQPDLRAESSFLCSLECDFQIGKDCNAPAVRLTYSSPLQERHEYVVLCMCCCTNTHKKLFQLCNLLSRSPGAGIILGPQQTAEVHMVIKGHAK